MESEAKLTKKPNPRETTNPLSSLFFLHMIPTFIRNYKNGIIKEDLYEALEEHKSSNLGHKLEATWKEEYTRHRRTALHRALFKLVAFEFVCSAFFQFFLEMVLVVVPQYSIGKLVEHFSNTNSQVSRNEAKWHTVIIIITLILDGVISYPILSMLFRHAGMKMRVACCSIIYRKSLRLNCTALAHTSVGQILNLLSNDVGKLDEGLSIFHFIWIAPMQTVVGTYLLYQAIGVSAFAGMGFLSLFLPLQIFLGKKTSVLRLRTALRTDERVCVMNEVLNGIQVIKMYTWEKPFEKIISYIRRFEIKSIRYRFFLQAIMTSLETFVARTAIFISIIVFISLGNKLTADTVYIITAIYVTMRPIITFSFSMSIACLAEMNISVYRIQKFMNHEELPKDKSDIIFNNFLLKDSHKEYDKTTSLLPRICFQNASAKWQDDSDEYTLCNINLTIENCQLVAIIGSVGSGKSSLLNSMIKELPLCEGSLQINGKRSYAAQEAWLFSASVRQNILFCEEYDEDRYKTVIKACALEVDLEMLPYGDRTLVGEKGKSLSGGQKARINLARCIYKRADIYLLDDPLSAVDTKVGKKLYQDCIKKFLSDKICVLITHQLQHIKNADRIIILDGGKIVGNNSYESLQRSCSNFSLLLKKFNAGEESQDLKKKIRSRQNSEVTDKCEDSEMENPGKLEESIADGHIKAITYSQYFKAGGNYFTLFGLFLLFTLNWCVAIGGDYFVCYWVDLEQALNENLQNDSSNLKEISRIPIIYTYSIIIAATIILSFVHVIFYFMFFMRASVNLHNSMFKMVMNGAMTFFNSNPTGRILNRFTKDIGVIDEMLPFILLDVVKSAFTLTGVIVLTLIVSPLLLAPFIIAIILYYLIRMVCVETTRSLKRIEGIERSPLFSHITASMHGLSTIRASCAQEVLIAEFDKYQDNHSSAWYLFITSLGAFTFWLESISILLISLVITSLLILHKDYYGGEVGLIVTQYMSLVGALQAGIRRWTDLENNMTSVERILEYTKIETEPIRKSYINNNIPKNWPTHGKIIFKNVSMKYLVNEQPVLTNLNFTINSCEKIGIVGRTGAGKTSTIAALFQMYKFDGSIIIDDVEIVKIPLNEFRPKISIIPQEPMLFTGTMRKNLDPFEEFKDEVIWNALEQVELKQVVSEIPQGLNCNMRESGNNFSIGQRQLVCLARAIIRKNKILIMDEATANVDPHTDSLIQTSIRKNFCDCTVITIAHRLHTIMDNDRVLVMDAGNVVEFDHPYNLLQQPNSLFHSMVQTAGSTVFKSLNSIAKENFEHTKKSL